MKTCTRCCIEKPDSTEYFHRNNQAIDGLHVYCKVCRSEIHKKYMSDPIVAKKARKKIREWQKGIGREKYEISKKRYDKSEKRATWRRNRYGAIKRIFKQKN